MDNPGFWSELFDTYQSLPDWLKFFWLIVPPLFTFGFAALVMRQWLAVTRTRHQLTGNLVYSVHRDEMDMLHVYLHSPENDAPGKGLPGRETGPDIAGLGTSGPDITGPDITGPDTAGFDTDGMIELLDRLLIDRRRRNGDIGPVKD